MKTLVILWTLINYAFSQSGVRPLRQPQPSAPGQVANIIRESNEVNIDGSYQWSFEADNGISAQETGQIKNANSQDPIEEAQGSFQYTGPDGAAVQLQYVANENGFQPQGAHLPVAPPIPLEIQRALEWNAAHPEEEEGGRNPPRRP